MVRRIALLFGILASACLGYQPEPPAPSELVCWTYLRPPRCEEAPAGVHTCCDHQTCNTWASPSPPTCIQAGENIYVCCGEDEG